MLAKIFMKKIDCFLSKVEMKITKIGNLLF